jgi:hypothetical protein
MSMGERQRPTTRARGEVDRAPDAAGAVSRTALADRTGGEPISWSESAASFGPRVRTAVQQRSLMACRLGVCPTVRSAGGSNGGLTR